MESPWEGTLWHLEKSRDLVGEFLKRTKGAKPATEPAAAPKEEGDGNGCPEDEHERVH